LIAQAVEPVAGTAKIVVSKMMSTCALFA